MNANKTELFHILADLTINNLHEKSVFITHEDQVRCCCADDVDVTTITNAVRKKRTHAFFFTVSMLLTVDIQRFPLEQLTLMWLC